MMKRLSALMHTVMGTRTTAATDHGSRRIETICDERGFGTWQTRDRQVMTTSCR